MPALQLGAADFAPLAEFGRRWRFTDPNYNVLPGEALARLQPLTPAAAGRLFAVASEIDCCSPSADTTIDADEDISEEIVTAALLALPIGADASVLVHWDHTDALITDWLTFSAYWSDFCYPSSDDVSVLPLHGAWSLCYHHREVFCFSGGRTAG